jgi:hypothetical protein
MQSEEDAARIKDKGRQWTRSGSQEPQVRPENPTTQRPVVIAPGRKVMLPEARTEVRPFARNIRQPAEKVSTLCSSFAPRHLNVSTRSAGLSRAPGMMPENAHQGTGQDVVLLDRSGELRVLRPLRHPFVGGSLVKVGGRNLLDLPL